MQYSRPKIISIVGLTASGKSSVSLKLAQDFGAEIISADSRQVYKRLDIGTAKVTAAEQSIVPHYLLDVAEPGERFNVADFQRMAYAAIDDILSRGKLPMLVGGTGLYSRSVVEGYDFPLGKDDQTDIGEYENMSLAELQTLVKACGVELNNSDFNNPRRLIRHIIGAKNKKKPNTPRYEVLQICLLPSKELVAAQIIARTDARLEQGLIEETRQLLADGVDESWLQALGLEYYWNVEHIRGRITIDEYKKRLAEKTIQFAKRQRTWFLREQNTLFLTDATRFYEDSFAAIKNFLDKRQ